MLVSLIIPLNNTSKPSQLDTRLTKNIKMEGTETFYCFNFLTLYKCIMAALATGLRSVHSSLDVHDVECI